MNEWNDPQSKQPKDGQAVEIKLPGGRIVKPVLFQDGRFWKYRKSRTAGHAYFPIGWKPLEAKKKGTDGSAKSTN